MHQVIVKSEGIILVSTVLFMALLSAILLMSLQTTYLFAKAGKEVERQHVGFRMLEKVAETFDWEHLMTSRCIIDSSDQNKPIDGLKNNGGCQFIAYDKDYRFIISKVMPNPALQVYSQGLYHTTHQRYLTLTDGQHYLQIRYAFIGSKATNEPKRVIKPGKQSWVFI